MLMNQLQAELGPDFKLIEVLGKGTFGVVYKVKYRDNEEYYAVKTLDKNLLTKNNMSFMIDMTRDEIKLLHKFQGISDKNIINLHCELETSNYIFMVLEYCQFDLREFIEKYKGLSEDVILHLFRQIVSGLNLLHKEHIVHRDIKLENIMIKSTQIQIEALNRQQLSPEQFLKGSQLKLIDLGVSKSLDSTQDLTGSYAGSNETMAPEINEEQLYGLKVDVYSVGAVLFELLTGLKYYQCKDTNKALKSFSDTTKTVIQHTLVIDQNQRWRPQEILNFLGSPPKLKLVKPKIDTLYFIRKELEDYDIQKKIGEVSFSNVHMGIHIATNQQVFIKILNLTEIKDPTKAKESAKFKEMAQQEIAILEQYKSPYLTKLVGSKVTEQFIFTILEIQYSELDLETLINRSYPQGMPPELATAILIQIALGLKVLHRHEIVHRELSADHIRFKNFDASNPKKILVQITEFGSSKKGKANSLVGSDAYRAPEVGEQEYDTKADIFSLGAIFMLMLTGKQGNMMLPSSSFPEKEENVLKSMLQFGSNYRPTLDELLDNLGYKPKIQAIEVDGTNKLKTKQEQEKTNKNNEVDDLKQESLFQNLQTDTASASSLEIRQKSVNFHDQHQDNKSHIILQQENMIEQAKEKLYYSFGVDKQVELKVSRFLIEMKDERNQTDPELLIMVHLYLVLGLVILSCCYDMDLKNHQNSIYKLIYSRINDKGTWNTQIKINDYVQESKNCCTPWHWMDFFASQPQLDEVLKESQVILLKPEMRKESSLLLIECIKLAIKNPRDLKGYLEIQNGYLK